MRHYETVFIADPDLSPDVQDNLFEKVRSLISGNAGDLIDFDEWGNKRLAYEIRKKLRGHYVRLDYCGTGETVSTLENAFRIDERVLKFMTILLAEDADPEQLKAALEATRPPVEKSAEAPAETPAEAPAEGSTEAVEEKAPESGEPEAAKEVADTAQEDAAGTETGDEAADTQD